MTTYAAHPDPEAGATEVAGQQMTSRLAWLGIAGIVLYVLLDVVAQALPPHYSPVRQAESDLAVGPYGWIMTVNFVVRGLLSLAVVAALWRSLTLTGRARVGLALLGVWSIGAFLLAAFPTDIGRVQSIHGKVHLVVALVAFVCAPVGEYLLSRALTLDSRCAALGARVTPVAAVALGALALQVVGLGLPRVGGLTERIFLTAVLLWLLLVALDLRAAATATGS